MKRAAGFLFFIILAAGCVNNNNGTSNMNSTESCFSETDFSIVYNYIEGQIDKGNKGFYEFDDYELYLKDPAEITLKQKGYTLARIIRGEGIFSLAIMQRDNERIVKKSGLIFHRILTNAKENSYR
jgi:hypothetical protein